MSLLTIQVHDVDASATLQGMLGRLADLSPAMQVIGDTIVDTAQMAINDGRSPLGALYAPLSKTTTAKRGPGAQPLRDTGRLMNSIQSADVTADGVTVGTNVIYAAVQQFGAKKGAFGTMRNGSPIPWGDIPARPFMPLAANGEPELPPAVADDILDIMGRFLDRAA